MAKHAEAQSVHLGAYFGATDPALVPANEVGPGKMWIDTSAGEGSAVLKFRNGADTDWVTLSGGGVPADAVLVDGEALTADGEIVTAG